MTSRTKARIIFEDAAWKCHYCNDEISVNVDGTDHNRATVDHKMPRALGGSDRLSNLVACCRACNQAKADMPYETFLAAIRGVAIENGIGRVFSSEAFTPFVTFTADELQSRWKKSPPTPSPRPDQQGKFTKRSLRLGVINPPPYQGIRINPLII